MIIHVSSYPIVTPLDCFVVFLLHLGPVSERRLSENSEYVNPEMRETLGFPFQNGRFVKPGKAG